LLAQLLSDCVALGVMQTSSLMFSGARSKFGYVCLVVVLLAFAASVRAQTADVQRDRVPMAEASEPWRFHTGDDPRWADPAFDDSTWSLIKPNEPLSTQGYSNYAGFGWYRVKLYIPADSRTYGIYIPEFSDSIQIFADGRLIAQYGEMPPHQRVYVIPPTVIPLPTSRPGEPIVVAARTWQWLYGTPTRVPGGGPTPLPRIGELATLREWADLQEKQRFWMHCADGLVAIVLLIGGLAGLALFALRRSEREYLWFALYEILQAGYVLGFSMYVSSSFLGWRQRQEIIWGLLNFAYSVAFLFFLAHLLKVRRSRLIGFALASAVVTQAVFQTGEVVWILTPGTMPWVAVALWNGAQIFTILPYWICVLILLWRAGRRGDPDARLLLFPIGLEAVVSDLTLALWVLSTLGLSRITAYFHWFQILITWPFPISLSNVSDLLVQSSLVAILVLRFARTRHQEEQLTSELEAARTVQQVLIPEKIPIVPGLQIDCVYKPAGQVGGDFFHVAPIPAGSALIVIGDVSGKGMPAAMTVSLLIGALHTAAAVNTSPAAILTILNRCAVTHSIGGFATCLILRIDADGKMMAANAGHLAPYLNGRELEVDNGLPLGITASATYSEDTLSLAADDQLTLVSDGVVEARDKHGELFGFDRTASIAISSAESIARSAQAHGQEDDITVLKITRQPVPNHAETSASANQITPARA
jgi:Stage II sporulation protein E (SpoIIE)